MKFGPLPLDRAEGAILAHSLRLSGGRLRKGAPLGAADIAALRAEGHDSVIAARLDPGDVLEDDAAAALAAALVPDPAGQGLEVRDAFTGRANLVAATPGVMLLDTARLHALNRIDPMVTLATLPPFQQVAAGQMAGTVKIISYAVAGAHLDAAREVLAGPPAIRVAPPVLKTARLIVTDIPGAAGEKGAEAVRRRLAALEMEMTGPITVPHEEGALAAAIAAADEDLILILTASATSDIGDVAPAALREAGGRVDRFGMPVDPGNLLFTGALGDRAVIGLPGCARSPALNGADWVLSRIACGIGVSGDDIAAMGVGGLLKEIPTRPQPRAGHKRGR
ncbi:MAG: molybdopterin-binding protein [Pseudooceanicola sp.]